MALSRAGKKRVMLVVAVLACAGLAFGAYGFRKMQLARNLASWRNQGLSAYEKGDLEAAIPPLSKYVTHDTTDEETLLAFADARRQIPLDNAAHLKQAISLTQIALNLDPQSLRARTMLLDLYRAIGYSTEARDAARAVLELDPSNRTAHETMIQSFFAAGRTDDAAQAALAMAKAIPNDIDVQRASLEYLIAADTPMDELKAFVDAQKESFADTLGFAIMQLQLSALELSSATPTSKDIDEKIASIKKQLADAAQIQATDAKQVKDLMRFYDVFEPDQAESVLASYMQSDSPLAQPLTLYAAMRHFKHNDIDAAAKVIAERTDDLSKASSQALFWLAMGHGKQAQDAAATLHNRTDADSQPWAALHDAFHAIDNHEPSQAIEVLSQPQAITDDDLQRLYDYATARAKMALGESAHAVSMLKAIVASDPTWYIAKMSLARAYLSLDRPLEARQLLRELGNVISVDPALLLNTEVAIDQNHLDRPNPTSRNSFDMLSALRKEHPDDPSLMVWTARAALATGHTDDALSLTDTLLKSKLPDDTQPVVMLAHEIRSIDATRAENLLTRVLEQHATPLAVFEQAKMAYRNQGAQAGRAILDNAIAKASDDDKPMFRLMLASYLDAIDDPEAQQMMLDLSAAYPNNLTIQQQILNTRAAWNDPKAIEPVIERLRKLTGDDGTQWAIYAARRQLAMIDPASSDADAQTSGVVRSLARVLRDDPTNTQALTVAARASEMLGDWNRATEYRVRAATSNPSSAPLQIAAIEALDKAGRSEQSQQHCRMLAAIPMTDTDAILQRADILERHGLADLARRDIEKLANAGQAGAQIRLAAQLHTSGKTTQAQSMIDRVLAKVTNDPESLSQEEYERLAGYFRDSGQPEKGLAILKALPEQSKVGNRDRIIAHYLFQTINTPEQAKKLETMARTSKDGYLWAIAAQGYMRLNDFDHAASIVDQGIKVVGNADELTSLKRMIDARQKGDPLTLLASLQTALSLRPSVDAQAIATLIDQRLTGKIDDPTLINELKTRTEQPNASWEAWQGYITALQTVNEREQAKDAIMRTLEVFSTSPEVARFAAVQLDRMGFARESLIAAQSWDDRSNHQSLDAAEMVAIGMLNVNRPAYTIKVLSPWRDVLLKNWKDHSQTLLVWGIALAKTGAVDQAHELLWPMTDDPTGTAMYLGVSHSIADPAARRAWLTRISPKVVKASPPVDIYNLANAWIALGRETGNQADLRQARNIIEPRLAQAADTPPFYLLIAAASVHDALGDLDLAADFYSRAIVQAPNNADLHNNLAYVLYKKGSALDDALTHANQAVDLAQQAGYPMSRTRSYLDTQAQILMKMGKIRQAADIYRKILADDATWPVGIIGLAECLEKLGEADAARSQLGQIPPQIKLTDELSKRVSALEGSLGD